MMRVIYTAFIPLFVTNKQGKNPKIYARIKTGEDVKLCKSTRGTPINEDDYDKLNLNFAFREAKIALYSLSASTKFKDDPEMFAAKFDNLDRNITI